MTRLAGLTAGTLLLWGVSAATSTALAQDVPADAAPVAASTADAEAADDAVTSAPVSAEDAAKAPESTEVSGSFVNADGTSASGGIVYMVFQNRLNEVPHANALDHIKSMAEATAVVDEEGSFSLTMKPGNFALIYDPTATEPMGEPGPNSMAVMRRLSKEQVQARIAAIKENAMKGLPIQNGKIEDAYVVENRYIRPPASSFADMQLQNKGTVTVKAVDDAGELITFPATLRLRGKNGDIMEPHTPSVSKKATYEFFDIMPQSYQVFALGTLPRPGAGDKLTTPTVTNDQFIYIGDPLTHEVVVKLPAEE